MAIQSPGARLLRDVPLSFVRRAGASKKRVDATIALVPFVDFLLTVVVFLLMTFSATGQAHTVADIPVARHGDALEVTPIVAIDGDAVTLEGRRVADAQALLASADDPGLEGLERDLVVLAENWRTLHPREPFPGAVTIQAGRGTDFRVLRKVAAAATRAGYGTLSFAVREP